MQKLYLGKRIASGKLLDMRQEMSPFDLTTHVFVCGSTGSGKTVLGKIIIEEALKNRIPAILIDLKGDLSSFAIPIREINYFSFEKWVEAISGESKNELLKKVLYQYQKNFETFEMTEEDLKEFRDSIDVEIFTPKSTITETLSLSPITSPPQNLEKLLEHHQEQVINLISSNVKSILSKAYPEVDIEKEKRVEMVFLEEILRRLWLQGKNLSGESGLKYLIKEVIDPQLAELEGLPLEIFFPKEKRIELARNLNTLLLGANRLWFHGKSIKRILDEIEEKINSGGKVPLVVFNLSFLDAFSEKNFVLSNIAYEISIWMRKKVSSGAPKLLFYLDEIGSGNTSFYPAEPYNNSSKEAINILLRQGRAFGICCILSTQNPGDIDYTGLTNCHTWFVGKLQTQEDREKILQGISNFHISSGNLENFLKTARSGEFAVKDKNGNIFEFKQRWLYSYHKVMGERDFHILSEILQVEKFLQQVEKLLKDKKYAEAKAILYKSLKDDMEENPYLLFEIAKIEMEEGNKDKALELLENIVATQIGDYSIWKMKSELEIEKQDWVAARNSLEQLLQFMPYDEWGIEKLGFVYLKLGEWELAQEMFEKILRIQEKNPQLYYLMAEVKVGQGDFLKAVEYINKAIDYDLENPDFYFLKGKIFFLLEENELALEAFMRVLELDDKYLEAYLKIAEIYFSLKIWNKALEFTKKALEISPSEIKAYLLLSKIYNQTGKEKESIVLLEKLLEKGLQNEEIYSTLAELYLTQGKKEKAMQLLHIAIKNNPQGEYLILMARILTELEREEEAIAVLEKLLEKESENVEALLLLSKLYKKMEKDVQLEEVLDKILQLDQTNDFALLEKAEILEKKGEIEGALNLYKKIKQKDLTIWRKIAVLNEEKGDLVEAVAAYDHLTDTIPDNPEFWLRKAFIFYQMDKLENALDACDRVKMLDENNVEMWNLMMHIFNRQGEYAKAKYCQDRIEELGGEVKYEF